jgi:hypothetical protein
MATKKIWQLIFFTLLFLDPGSGMGKNQDPGSEINIPDQQHWILMQYFDQLKWAKPGPYSCGADRWAEPLWRGAQQQQFIFLPGKSSLGNL